MLTLRIQEARTSTINIEEFDADTVSYMVSFMYTGNYYFTPKSESSELDATTQGM